MSDINSLEEYGRFVAETNHYPRMACERRRPEVTSVGPVGDPDATIMINSYHDEDASSVVLLALGLLGEAGEYVEKLDELHRGANDAILELGDCLWYWVAIGQRMRWAHTPECVAYAPPVALLCHASKFCERLKKAYRNDRTMTEVSREALETLWRNAGARIATRAVHHGVDLVEVARRNVEKLRGRRERGTLCGEGDNR